jgi:cytochrome c biogenesis protein CcmG, thiol:disulfide interchange protein DsbE
MQRMISWFRDRKRWVAATVVLMSLGIAWAAASRIPDAEIPGEEIASPQEGFLAPDFRLETIDDGAVTLSTLRGRVVVVNLWASWCPPCRAEMPALQAVYEDFEAQGLAVLGVNMTYQDSEAEAASFAAKLGLTFPIALDYSGEIAGSYRMRALPTTFFIDERGIIRQVLVGGPLNEATIRSVVKDMLEESY